MKYRICQDKNDNYFVQHKWFIFWITDYLSLHTWCRIDFNSVEDAERYVICEIENYNHMKNEHKFQVIKYINSKNL